MPHVRATHATLNGTTVDVIPLGDFPPIVEVLNRSGTAALWLTLDSSDPVAEADNNLVVPAGSSLIVDTTDAPELRILGDGNAYSVSST